MDWHINGPMAIAIVGILINQYWMHRKNIQTLTIIRYRVGMIWHWYCKEHKIQNGEIE